MLPVSYNITQCGDHAITVELGDNISPYTHKKVMALFHYLKSITVTGIKDIIPAYATVTIVYDIDECRKTSSSLTASHYIIKTIEKLIQDCDFDNVKLNGKEITIPVCYDILLGTDLSKMAGQKNMSVEEIVSIHTSIVYDVYMTGFLPGFPYMGMVDDVIATPRLSKPRVKVAAGSVGIAGNQTGIYPLESPGGWNIIGQTPVKIFDVSKSSPCLLQPGDKVKFTPISIKEFNKQKLL